MKLTKWETKRLARGKTILWEDYVDGQKEIERTVTYEQMLALLGKRWWADRYEHQVFVNSPGRCFSFVIEEEK